MRSIGQETITYTEYITSYFPNLKARKPPPISSPYIREFPPHPILSLLAASLPCLFFHRRMQPQGGSSLLRPWSLPNTPPQVENRAHSLSHFSPTNEELSPLQDSRRLLLSQRLRWPTHVHTIGRHNLHVHVTYKNKPGHGLSCDRILINIFQIRERKR